MDHDMPPQVGPTPRAFPVPRPAPDDLPRLTDGLVRAVAACLNYYGWPQAQGRDLPALRDALAWFMFDSADPIGYPPPRRPRHPINQRRIGGSLYRSATANEQGRRPGDV
ncbi:hypothetical protein GCE86_06720 [Micromonospora terminaliae]|uniref:Uncharacterized protein n=1 Tax=Micromonospora terminaliae TaxID=1914461 RepID=A0AAJ2ZHL9_9ACTN|nr:hypothetical protein [Micromonospora terminaliae]NES30058.1 hypothetical protein [Micromonospora terminaliae]QGL46769.1 hypothetical protein GCE86_06720 [Micromonospora terminaliae]